MNPTAKDLDPLAPLGQRCMGLLLIGATACSEITISGQNEEVTEAPTLVETFVQAPLPKVDVLWVVDNSPSMASEHSSLQQALSPFMEELETASVAWQMGVLSTELEAESLGILHGNPWILSPNLESPMEALQQALDVGTNGRGLSGGIAATLMALSDPYRNDENRGFRRADASLHVIVFSDSDDQSSSLIGEDVHSEFLAFVDEEFELTGQNMVLSAVVGDAGVGCLGEGGGALPGTQYIALAQATGGTTGSICDTDFSSLLTQLGEASISWPSHFSLQTTPVPNSVRVSLDGQRLDTGWWIEQNPPAVGFVDPPSPGVQIEVRYEVQQ